jgi:hypothetical protein
MRKNSVMLNKHKTSPSETGKLQPWVKEPTQRRKLHKYCTAFVTWDWRILWHLIDNYTKHRHQRLKSYNKRIHHGGKNSTNIAAFVTKDRRVPWRKFNTYQHTKLVWKLPADQWNWHKTAKTDKANNGKILNTLDPTASPSSYPDKACASTPCTWGSDCTDCSLVLIDCMLVLIVQQFPWKNAIKNIHSRFLKSCISLSHWVSSCKIIKTIKNRLIHPKI